MTPAEKAGHTKGVYLRVVTEDLSCNFSKGSIVTIYEDDKSEGPLYRLVDGECKFNNAGGSPGAFEHFPIHPEWYEFVDMTRTEAAYVCIKRSEFDDFCHLGSHAFTREDLEKYRQLVSDGYTLWLDGGECPVDEGDKVDVVLSNWHEEEDCDGSRCIWAHDGEMDIIAYRVIEDADEKPDSDMVNNPPHYQILPGVEVYDIRCALMDKIQGATHAQVSDWDRAVEYLLRMWDKNGIQDAKKARWYLDKLIEKLEK